MENEILSLISSISIESLIIGIIVFILTMFIKYPIKKMTSNLEENKRKAYNSFIIIIPILLSLIISILYLVLQQHGFTVDFYLKLSTTSSVVSFVLYAIFQRIIIIIKGIKNNSKEEEMEKNIDSIKKTFNALIAKLDIDKQQVEKLQNQIDIAFLTKNETNKNTYLENLEI